MPNLSTFKASDKTVWSRHEPVDAVSLVDMMEQALHDPCHPRAQDYRLLLLDMHGLTEQGKEVGSWTCSAVRPGGGCSRTMCYLAAGLMLAGFSTWAQLVGC